jgi:hypothetical protein
LARAKSRLTVEIPATRGIKWRDFVARLFAGFKSAAWHEEAEAARNQNRRHQLAVSAARKRQKQTRRFHDLIINR